MTRPLQLANGTGASDLVTSSATSRNAIAGLTIPSGSGTTSLAIGGTPHGDGSTKTFTVTATDSVGGTTFTNYSITVNGVASNQAQVAIVTSGSAPAPTSFVESVYLHLLGRSADPAGLADWTALLNTLGNTSAGRSQVVAGIEQSPEYLNDVVTSLYEHYLNRAPDPAAVGWVTALENGATVEQVIVGIVSSPEFLQNAGDTNAGYVNALYASILGRPADASGYADWLNALNTGTSRAAVALAFLTSPEYREDLVAGVGWTPQGGQATPGSYFQGYYLASLGRQGGDPEAGVEATP